MKLYKNVLLLGIKFRVGFDYFTKLHVRRVYLMTLNETDKDPVYV